ncbi:MAG: VPLPA-CTERM sorting domain-containing protein [Pseudomonadota bacterium]
MSLFKPAAALAAAAFSTLAFANAAEFTVRSGQNLQVPSFDTATDRFLIATDSFGFDDSLKFLNTDSNGIDDIANLIVLQDSDDDNDMNTVFNARSAARLIGAGTDVDRDGFFVYYNSALNINRLVYSSNLADGNASFQIIAAILDPTGQNAIAALPTFTDANFGQVPVPAAAVLFGGAMAGFGALRRKRAAQNA